jgi:hypothetical protein
MRKLTKTFLKFCPLEHMYVHMYVRRSYCEKLSKRSNVAFSDHTWTSHCDVTQLRHTAASHLTPPTFDACHFYFETCNLRIYV